MSSTMRKRSLNESLTNDVGQHHSGSEGLDPISEYRNIFYVINSMPLYQESEDLCEMSRDEICESWSSRAMLIAHRARRAAAPLK